VPDTFKVSIRVERNLFQKVVAAALRNRGRGAKALAEKLQDEARSRINNITGETAYGGGHGSEGIVVRDAGSGTWEVESTAPWSAALEYGHVMVIYGHRMPDRWVSGRPFFHPAVEAVAKDAESILGSVRIIEDV